MKCSIGDLVIVSITGRVAEKGENGKLTGNMISFEDGDIGTIVDVHGKGMRDKVFTVRLSEGVVVLKSNSLRYPEERELRIPQSVIEKAHPDYEIRDKDKDEGVGYLVI